jgi:hypothetical protein
LSKQKNERAPAAGGAAFSNGFPCVRDSLTRIIPVSDKSGDTSPAFPPMKSASLRSRDTLRVPTAAQGDEVERRPPRMDRSDNGVRCNRTNAAEEVFLEG